MFLNAVRQNLVALGLDRRKAGDALTIQDVVREFDLKKGGRASDSSGEAEIAIHNATSREIWGDDDTAEESKTWET